MTLTKSINTLKNAVLNGSIKDAKKLIQDGEVFVDNQMSILRSLISDTKFDMIELLLEHNKISFTSDVKELIEHKNSVLPEKLLSMIQDKIAHYDAEQVNNTIATAKVVGKELLSDFKIIEQNTTEKVLSAYEKADKVKQLIDNNMNIANLASRYESLDAEFIAELLKMENHGWAVFELTTRDIIKKGTEAYKTLKAAYDDLNIMEIVAYLIWDYLAILPTIQKTEIQQTISEIDLDTLGDSEDIN